MKRVLILSGPTHEYLDPVRYLGNASSGLMGKALAQEANARGADVTFITGPVCSTHLPIVEDIRYVTSASDMLAEAKKFFSDADIIIFAAAIADYRPAEPQTKKIEKGSGNLTLKLEPAPDIAATLCANKRKNQVAVGFALQTHNGEEKAKKKLVSKNLDGIVLNTLATLGADTGLFTWIDSGHSEDWGVLGKADCAKKIFENVT